MKLQFLSQVLLSYISWESVHMSHCTQFPLILLWEPCGSFTPVNDSCFFQGLFLTVQLLTSSSPVLRSCSPAWCTKPYSQAMPLGFLLLMCRTYRGGVQKCSGQSAAQGLDTPYPHLLPEEGTWACSWMYVVVGNPEGWLQPDGALRKTSMMRESIYSLSMLPDRFPRISSAKVPKFSSC